MNDHIRISDADRERVTARLREHYAEGRLSSDELDERITAALSAKTVGDLRAVMVDLPDPEAAPAQGRPYAPWAMGPRVVVRRGPRLLPLALIALVAALVLPGAGWVFLAFLKVALLVWLVACLAGIFAVASFRRHVRRHWQSGYGSQWLHYKWRGL